MVVRQVGQAEMPADDKRVNLKRYTATLGPLLAEARALVAYADRWHDGATTPPSAEMVEHVHDHLRQQDAHKTIRQVTVEGNLTTPGTLDIALSVADWMRRDSAGPEAANAYERVARAVRIVAYRHKSNAWFTPDDGWTSLYEHSIAAVRLAASADDGQLTTAGHLVIDGPVGTGRRRCAEQVANLWTAEWEMDLPPILLDAGGSDPARALLPEEIVALLPVKLNMPQTGRQLTSLPDQLRTHLLLRPRVVVLADVSEPAAVADLIGPLVGRSLVIMTTTEPVDVRVRSYTLISDKNRLAEVLSEAATNFGRHGIPPRPITAAAIDEVAGRLHGSSFAAELAGKIARQTPEVGDPADTLRRLAEALEAHLPSHDDVQSGVDRRAAHGPAGGDEPDDRTSPRSPAVPLRQIVGTVVVAFAVHELVSTVTLDGPVQPERPVPFDHTLADTVWLLLTQYPAPRISADLLVWLMGLLSQDRQTDEQDGEPTRPLRSDRRAWAQILLRRLDDLGLVDIPGDDPVGGVTLVTDDAGLARVDNHARAATSADVIVTIGVWTPAPPHTAQDAMVIESLAPLRHRQVGTTLPPRSPHGGTSPAVRGPLADPASAATVPWPWQHEPVDVDRLAELSAALDAANEPPGPLPKNDSRLMDEGLFDTAAVPVARPDRRWLIERLDDLTTLGLRLAANHDARAAEILIRISGALEGHGRLELWEALSARVAAAARDRLAGTHGETDGPEATRLWASAILVRARVRAKLHADYDIAPLTELCRASITAGPTRDALGDDGGLLVRLWVAGTRVGLTYGAPGQTLHTAHDDLADAHQAIADAMARLTADPTCVDASQIARGIGYAAAMMTRVYRRVGNMMAVPEGRQTADRHDDRDTLSQLIAACERHASGAPDRGGVRRASAVSVNHAVRWAAVLGPAWAAGGDQLGLMFSRLHESRLARLTGQIPRAMHAAADAQTRAMAIGDLRAYGDALNATGRAARHMSAYSIAADLFATAEQTFGQLRDVMRANDSGANLARALLEAGEDKRASDHLRRLARAFDDDDRSHPRERGYIAVQFARHAVRHGYLDLAHERFVVAEKLWRDSLDATAVAHLKGHRAVFHVRVGEFDAAIACATEALRIQFEEVHDPVGLVSAAIKTAEVIYETAKQPGQTLNRVHAATLAASAAAMADKFGLPDAQVWSHLLAARILLREHPDGSQSAQIDGHIDAATAAATGGGVTRHGPVFTLLRYDRQFTRARADGVPMADLVSALEPRYREFLETPNLTWLFRLKAQHRLAHLAAGRLNCTPGAFAHTRGDIVDPLRKAFQPPEGQRRGHVRPRCIA